MSAKTRYQISVYGPNEDLVWQKDLTDEDVAALMPAIDSTGGPDLASGCWSLNAFFEPYAVSADEVSDER